MAVGVGLFPENYGVAGGYDTGYPEFNNNLGTNTNKGRPTVNVSSGYGMSTYNNVGSVVSSDLFTINETFKGATVYRQVLTPLNSTGASYLTGGNNPGIGVVTSGGGGTGGIYTGHSIYFRPHVPMHSSPIFTHYSNIGGWQSSNLYEYVRDGWYRAFVTWYDTVTRSDGKYWAINPQSAVANRSITIDWAGPFRENLNSPTVTPFTASSRSSTQSLIDIAKSNSVEVGNVSFDSNNTMFFDGSNDYVSISNYTAHQSDGGTLEAVVRLDTNSGDRYVMGVGGTTTYGASRAIRCNGGYWSTVSYGSSTQDYNGIVAAPTGTWQHIAFVWTNTTTVNFYLNGTLYSTTKSGMVIPEGTEFRIGNPPWTTGAPHHGLIPVAKHYHRPLSTAEIQRNYQTYKRRFGI